MSDLDALVALVAAHKVETGLLTRDELASMLASAFFSLTGPEGLLITFDQAAPYDSPNFLWFKARYAQFVYIDRIIIAPDARGQGAARRFYEALFTAAHTAGHDRVTCEINLDPPNPGSIAFHDAMGFVEIGQAVLENGKTVSYREVGV